jgi:hypothetical protein
MEDQKPQVEIMLYIFANIDNLFINSLARDKLNSTKFALPAIYRPSSLILLHLWRASPATTNGNEQAHHNAYHEGVHLTLLADLMKGMRFDKVR